MTYLIIFLTLAVLGAIAVGDLRHRRIANLAVLALAGLYFLSAVTSGTARFIPAHLFVAAVVLVAMLLPYRLGWLGAGDVKMLTAGFLWAGVEWAFPLSLFLALATSVQAGFIWAGMLPTVGEGLRRKVPYGPAISAAMALMLVLQLAGFGPALPG